MRQITIQIPDQQYDFFMQLVRQLKFVKIKKEILLEEQLTSSQQETWKNIKQGFEELKLVEQGKAKTRPIKEVLDEL